MIKWFKCLIWGHDWKLTEIIKIKIHSQFSDIDYDYGKIYRYECEKCKRIKKDTISI